MLEEPLVDLDAAEGWTSHEMRVIAHSGPSSLLPPRALISSQGLEFYMEKYPDVAGQKVLGFLDYSLLLGLQVRMGPKE